MAIVKTAKWMSLCWKHCGGSVKRCGSSHKKAPRRSPMTAPPSKFVPPDTPFAHPPLRHPFHSYVKLTLGTARRKREIGCLGWLGGLEARWSG